MGGLATEPAPNANGEDAAVVVAAGAADPDPKANGEAAAVGLFVLLSCLPNENTPLDAVVEDEVPKVLLEVDAGAADVDPPPNPKTDEV